MLVLLLVGNTVPCDACPPLLPLTLRLTFMLVVLPVGSSTPISLSTERTVTISAPCATGQQLCGTPPSCSQVSVECLSPRPASEGGSSCAGHPLAAAR